MMTPEEIGAAYDRIAAWWDAAAQESGMGLPYLIRAVGLCANKGSAVDVGCGSGRLIGPLVDAGFRVTGLDVSASLLAMAKTRHPAATFLRSDVCRWEPPEPCDLIVAWDSTFHVPLKDQREVHVKLCSALRSGGVILFTAGGVRGERTGTMQGAAFYHSSLDAADYLHILDSTGCRCLLLEHDQHPEDHCVIIGMKRNIVGVQAVAGHAPQGRQP